MSTLGLHPEMVPSSVQNMNKGVCPLIMKEFWFPLKITPVTLPGVEAPAAAGILTTSGIAVPVSS
jgi:hypothetical protein